MARARASAMPRVTAAISQFSTIQALVMRLPAAMPTALRINMGNSYLT